MSGGGQATASEVTRTVEVFRPGTFTPMAGSPISFTEEDLKALAAGYDADAHPAPAVVGHPKTDDPAFAWARAFRWDDGRKRLLADLGEIEPAFGEAVAAGRYKRVSLSLFTPDAPHNPKPGQYYPKHIGFLGAAAPAVSGLKPVQFSADEAGVATFEFADASALRDVAGCFEGCATSSSKSSASILPTRRCRHGPSTGWMRPLIATRQSGAGFLISPHPPTRRLT